MYFYTKYTLNHEKARHYYDLLKESLRDNTKENYTINKENLIIYAEKQFQVNKSSSQLIQIFNQLNCKTLNEKSTFEALKGLLSGPVYVNTKSVDFMRIVESIYASNFIERNVEISSLVMVKFFEDNNLVKAFSYFKLNLEKYNKSIMEIYLSSLLSRDEQLANELNKCLSDYFEKNLVENITLLTHLLNSNFVLATDIYKNKLKSQFDVKTLERLLNQIKINKFTRFSRQAGSLRNIPAFFKKQNNLQMYEQTSQIIKLHLKNKKK